MEGVTKLYGTMLFKYQVQSMHMLFTYIEPIGTFMKKNYSQETTKNTMTHLNGKN
jgi:hypothetical protein